MNGATCTGDGSGVSFDGTDDYIDLEPFTFGGNLTISMWVRFDDLSSRQMLCAFQQSSGDTLALGIFNSVMLRLEMCPTGKCSTVSSDPPTYVVESSMVRARSHRCYTVATFVRPSQCPLVMAQTSTTNWIHVTAALSSTGDYTLLLYKGLDSQNSIYQSGSGGYSLEKLSTSGIFGNENGDYGSCE